MKITLIVLGVVFLQMSIALVIAQLIRAGRGSAGGERSRERDHFSPTPSIALIDSTAATNALAAMAREIAAQQPQTAKAPPAPNTARL